MIIEYGEWAPDLPDPFQPGLTKAQNVIALDRGYTYIRNQETASSNGLDARLRGAITTQNGSTIIDFLGNASKLYSHSTHTGALSDVSKVGGYSTSLWWDFAQYGKYVIAVNGGTSGADNPQVWELGTSSAFADLGGSPPKAETIAVVRDFVVMGHTYDAAGRS